MEISEGKLRHLLTQAYLHGEGAGRAEAMQEPWPKHDNIIERLVDQGRNLSDGKENA